MVFLKAHNHLYRDIIINHNLLDTLVPETILPIHIEHILPSSDSDTLTSRYDTNDKSPYANHIFESVLISDVDTHASPNELKAAAIRHLSKIDAGIFQVQRSSQPENEFGNVNLFPRMFPSLFPYGIGGFEHPDRKKKVSLRTHVKHLL